jgi:hypothetical protein
VTARSRALTSSSTPLERISYAISMPETTTDKSTSAACVDEPAVGDTTVASGLRRRFTRTEPTEPQNSCINSTNSQAEVRQATGRQADLNDGTDRGS